MHDANELERLLDKVKVNIFIGNDSAFLSTVMCSCTFHWDTSIDTAATNGAKIFWNPEHFLGLPVETRETVLRHELWHIARAHVLRAEGLNREAWQYATDVVINNSLQRSGSSFAGTMPLMDLSYARDTPEEQVYEDYLNNMDMPDIVDFDLLEPSKEELRAASETLVKIDQIIKAQQGAGSTFGSEAELLSGYVIKLVAPIINWKYLLYNFFDTRREYRQTYSPRNRRFPNILMPSYTGETDILGEIYYYLDTSGSVSDQDIVRFHSELNYLLNTFEMESIKVIQFDEEITHEQVIQDYTLPIVQVGRRGTDLSPVRDHIELHKPRSVIIFSDLDCDPMRRLSYPVNLIWVVVGNQDVYPDFGKTIHIPRE